MSLVVALVLAPMMAAEAQFTALVQPPAKKDNAAVIVAAQEKARQDSITAGQVTDLKVWVDSAAGTVGVAGSTTTYESGGDVQVKQEAVVVPDTATPLPTVALTGLALLGAGVALLRRRRSA